MTLLEIEVHSNELELLQQAAEEYDWEAIKAEVEPKFREAAVDFRDQKHSSNARRKKDIENPARGIAKITKHGNVQCIAGHNMVFLSKLT